MLQRGQAMHHLLDDILHGDEDADGVCPSARHNLNSTGFKRALSLCSFHSAAPMASGCASVRAGRGSTVVLTREAECCSLDDREVEPYLVTSAILGSLRYYVVCRILVLLKDLLDTGYYLYIDHLIPVILHLVSRSQN